MRLFTCVLRSRAGMCYVTRRSYDVANHAPTWPPLPPSACVDPFIVVCRWQHPSITGEHSWTCCGFAFLVCRHAAQQLGRNCEREACEKGPGAGRYSKDARGSGQSQVGRYKRRVNDWLRSRSLEWSEDRHECVEHRLKHRVVEALDGGREGGGEGVGEGVLWVRREHHVGEPLVARRREDGLPAGRGGEDEAGSSDGVDDAAARRSDGVHLVAAEGRPVGDGARSAKFSVNQEHVVGREREARPPHVLVNYDARDAILAVQDEVACLQAAHQDALCRCMSCRLLAIAKTYHVGINGRDTVAELARGRTSSVEARVVSVASWWRISRQWSGQMGRRR
eukprot:6195857-Pleurochrysis_carterae.AAC.2